MEELNSITSSIFHFKSKRLLVLILLGFVSINFGIGYSLWDKANQVVDDPIIDIGVGAVIQVSETLNPGPNQKLIPYGAFKGANDIEEFIYTYTVRLNKDGMLTAKINRLLVGEDATLTHMFTVTVIDENRQVEGENQLTTSFQKEAEAEYHTAVITFRIRLNHPTTQAEYLAIQGKRINLTFTFTASEKTD